MTRGKASRPPPLRRTHTHTCTQRRTHSVGTGWRGILEKGMWTDGEGGEVRRGDSGKTVHQRKAEGEVRPGAVTLLVLEHLHSGQVSHNYVNYFTTQLRAGREMEIQSWFWWRRTCVALHLSSHSVSSDFILLFGTKSWGFGVKSVVFGEFASGSFPQIMVLCFTTSSESILNTVL